MKFAIAHRLFFAVLLSMLAVAFIGLLMVRWQLLDAGTTRADAARSAHVEAARLQQLGDVLAGRFGVHHDWSFLPPSPADRRDWLREALLELPATETTSQDRQRFSASLDERIGLLDENQRYLAGTFAHRLMITFASIDTIERPVIVDGRVVGFLVMARTISSGDQLTVAFLVRQQDSLLAIAGIGVLLSALAAAGLAANFRRPIERLVVGARRLGAGHFDTRLGIARSDELGELAETFDHLAARLADAERSRRQWVADTSHELRTPLAVLRGQLEALQDGVRSATPENVAIMLRAVLSLSRRVDDLYELARADVGQLQYDKSPNDIWPLVVETVAGFAGKFHAAGLTATVGAAPARSTVRCDGERIRQVLANLLENCARYTASGGRVEVHGEVLGNDLHLVIDDSAPAVPDSALGRLGERFFRTDSARSEAVGGAGLGLALCRQIVEAHGGKLRFETSPLGGLRVGVVLNLEAGP